MAADESVPMNTEIAPCGGELPTKRRILITGIAGAIGKCISPALAARGHEVRGLDQRALEGFECVVGDIADPAVVRSAMGEIDTVIHLAAYPSDADFYTHLLRPNVLGLVNICQAAAEAKVGRLILASSGQVLWGHRALMRERPVKVSDGPAPTNFYALTKVWAEETGAMFARTHAGLTVLAVRIGWFARNPREMQRIGEHDDRAIYLSHRDACRFFIAAAESTLVGSSSERFHILFAYGNAGHLVVDMAGTQRLIGYEPQDDYPEGSIFDRG